MEISANRQAFLATLYWGQTIVERRHTMPILANVLLEAEGKAVRLTATDLEVGVRSRLDAEVVANGAITLNAKKLYEIAREAPEESLRLRRLDNDWVEIRSGKAVFKVVGMDAREFPQFPAFSVQEGAALPAGTLLEMIGHTLFAVSTDETRHNLSGVYLEEREGGKLRMVATDGHRLALIEKAIGPLGLEKGVILPRKGLLELKKLLEESEEGLVSVAFRDGMGFVTRDPVELFMRLVDADFPDYTKVIPANNPHQVRVSQGALLQALRRVSIVSNERYRGVRVEFKPGRMGVSASNPDLGEAVEEVEAEYEGKPLVIGFNARYLIDVLAVLGEGEVRMSLKDEVSPGLVRREGDEEYLYVVMPMRL
jgi:DNA polymerase-3 subunit beta